MPRYRRVPASTPEGEPTYSEMLDEEFEREVQAEVALAEGPGQMQEALARRRIAVRDRDPYAEDSPHSWVPARVPRADHVRRRGDARGGRRGARPPLG
jgi:hypothetical protein